MSRRLSQAAVNGMWRAYCHRPSVESVSKKCGVHWADWQRRLLFDLVSKDWASVNQAIRSVNNSVLRAEWVARLTSMGRRPTRRLRNGRTVGRPSVIYVRSNDGRLFTLTGRQLESVATKDLMPAGLLPARRG
jgi:hypothetical protein